MRAVRLIKPGCRLETQQIPVPTPNGHDVLIRVKAAGICHSDAHYRVGRSRVHPIPLTLGHEVAGVVEAVGPAVTGFRPGARVCVHYLATCGECNYCRSQTEQFCPSGAMMGKYRDGGYAEFVAMPERSVFPLPEEVPFDQGAIMMCSSATSLHALNKARFQKGDSVAIFGAGGLGLSAIQLARAQGASAIYAVDIKASKLALARGFGAIPVHAGELDPVTEIQRLTDGRGVDVALELIGLPLTMRQALLSLAILGRVALVGITDLSFQLAPYQELLNKETEVIGVSDHLAREIPGLLESARAGHLDLSKVITRRVPLEADAINETLDRLENFGDDGRVVIVP